MRGEERREREREHVHFMKLHRRDIIFEE